MKRISVLFIVFALCTKSYAQKHELGGSLGASNFLGDLGGANKIGTTFLIDLEPKLFMPAGGIFYRYNFKKFAAIRVELLATELKGDDKLTNPAPELSASWFRTYRNLNFRSPIAELLVMGEFDILRYKDRYFSHSYWTPFVAAGVGGFFMDPRTLDGNVRLQPLGTEGQGLPGYKPKYSLIQPVFPVSLGVKYQLNKHWKFSVEYMHHFTITDYIDDVSGQYVSLSEWQNAYDPGTASHVYALSRRSQELDPDNTYGYITAPGQQRGDPRNKDQYFMILFKASYVFGSGYDYNCPRKRR